MTLVARLLFLLVSWPPVFCHYGSGWDATHTGTQIWSVRCNAEKQDCMTKALGMMERWDVLHHSDSGMEVVVPFVQLNEIKAYLWESKLQYTVLVEDLAQQLKEQHEEEMLQKAGRISREICTADSCTSPLLEDYMSWQQVEWFLLDLANAYPKQVKAVTVGTSVEGRNLWLVTVELDNTVGVWQESSSGHRSEPRKAIFVEGGAHAREWIAHATTLNILKNQVNDCSAGINCAFVYYFMPLINPDGYEYSRKNNRLWRKNKSAPPSRSHCYGTDLNRNWAFHWGGASTSSNPCRNNYKGTKPFSTPEVYHERKSIETLQQSADIDLVLYISYHSYGQLVLYPWGYSTEAVAPNAAELRKGGEVYANAARLVHGKTYVAKKSSGLYPAGGVSDDHVKNMGVRYAYIMELRGNSSSPYGFTLPASQIKPTVEENWAAFTALANEVWQQSGSLLSACAI